MRVGGQEGSLSSSIEARHEPAACLEVEVLGIPVDRMLDAPTTPGVNVGVDFRAVATTHRLAVEYN